MTTTAANDPAPARSAADGSPLDVMLTDAALGPIRRMLPGFAGVKLAAQLAARPVGTTRLERSGWPNWRNPEGSTESW